MLKIRTVLLLWHRWFGLLAAIWLLALALTGSTLVFYDELDRLLNPELRRVEAKAQRLPLSQVIANAAGPGRYASFIDLPNRPGDSLKAYLAARDGADTTVAAGTHVFINPHTGEALGERIFGAFRLDRRHLMDFIYQLHLNLHLGGWMQTALGVLALCWLVDHLAGAILSFPNLAKWKRSFLIRSGAKGHKLTFDLHRAGGLWLAPITLTLAVSGAYFNLSGWFEQAVSVVSPVTPTYLAAAPTLPAPVYAMPVSIDAAIRIAESQAGGAAVDLLRIDPAKGLYELFLFDPRDPADYGGRRITLDGVSGALRSDFHGARGSAGDVFLAWQYPLHSGKALGWPGRISILAAGLAVLLLCVTGLLISLRKHRCRAAGRAD